MLLVAQVSGMLLTCGRIFHAPSGLVNMVIKGQIILIAVAKLLDVFTISKLLTRQGSLVLAENLHACSCSFMKGQLFEESLEMFVFVGRWREESPGR